ncbi:MAG: OsmC family protein [Bacteroidota bacterium]|nr:OsmC family protein [Bacteroidota bacterium]
MKEKIDCTWQDEMAFVADVNGFKLTIDAVEAVGGRNLGPQPKPLTLVSLAGCTGMDVISILKKMRVTPEYFNVEVEGNLSEEHPKYYQKIHIKYVLRGKDIPLDKVQKAVDLSQDRYCGVNRLLKDNAEITNEIIIE